MGVRQGVCSPAEDSMGPKCWVNELRPSTDLATGIVRVQSESNRGLSEGREVRVYWDLVGTVQLERDTLNTASREPGPRWGEGNSSQGAGGESGRLVLGKFQGPGCFCSSCSLSHPPPHWQMSDPGGVTGLETNWATAFGIS